MISFLKTWGLSIVALIVIIIVVIGSNVTLNQSQSQQQTTEVNTMNNNENININIVNNELLTSQKKLRYKWTKVSEYQLTNSNFFMTSFQQLFARYVYVKENVYFIGIPILGTNELITIKTNNYSSQSNRKTFSLLNKLF